jgi:hypothetical protein
VLLAVSAEVVGMATQANAISAPKDVIKQMPLKRSAENVGIVLGVGFVQAVLAQQVGLAGSVRRASSEALAMAKQHA